MRFADELVGPDELELPELARKADRREVEMAGQLISSLHAPFRPEKLHDEYREAVLEAIRRRAEGEEIAAPGEPEPEPEPEGDLLDALKASLPAGKGGGRRTSSTKRKSTSKRAKA
jgi:DNA end-binding protein Ku